MNDERMSIFRRGTARGVLGTAITGWLVATIPMIASYYALSESGGRSTQLFAVIFVAVVSAPIALLIAGGFVPAHLVLQRQGRARPWPYLGWGVLLMLVACAYIVVVNPAAREVPPADFLRFVAGAAGVGAGLGTVFWLLAVRLR